MSYVLDYGSRVAAGLHQGPGVPLDHLGQTVEYGLFHFVSGGKAAGVGTKQQLVAVGQRVKDCICGHQDILVVHNIVPSDPRDLAVRVRPLRQDEI